MSLLCCQRIRGDEETRRRRFDISRAHTGRHKSLLIPLPVRAGPGPRPICGTGGPRGTRPPPADRPSGPQLEESSSPGSRTSPARRRRSSLGPGSGRFVFVRQTHAAQSLHVHRLAPLPLLSLLLLVIVVLFLFFSFIFLVLLAVPPGARRRPAGLERLGVAEGAAVVVEEPAEGELVEGVLRVLPVRRAQRVQRPRAVAAVAPRPGDALLLHGVEVGRVHRVSDLGPVGRRLLPQVAGEVHLGEEGVGLDFAGAIGAQAVLRGAAEAADDVHGLGAELDLRGHLQRALPVDDLQTQRVTAAVSYRFT
ncbi:hypothetical protein EYF80_036687 [Liparis tanakae]|uniref:Uncharacterized protein n=1 Tax=Liparis tanakae TaxID=230148 RepID=A0A4Z2GIN5_9TELE|nr:hypothetical protein EYF80_036687 [Liparis tanakae]